MTCRCGFASGVAVVLALAAAACGATINEVLTDPAKYRDRTVTVKGQVAESATVMGRGVYRITDGDQALWVVTRGGAPRRGARVEVTGRVQDGFDASAFGSAITLPESLQSGVVLIEESHTAHD